MVVVVAVVETAVDDIVVVRLKAEVDALAYLAITGAAHGLAAAADPFHAAAVALLIYALVVVVLVAAHLVGCPDGVACA